VSPLDDILPALLPTVGADPVLRIASGSDGRPVAASAIGRIDATVDRIWKVLTDVERYADRVPLMDRVRVRGDVIDFGLRFRVSFFSVAFSFQSQLRMVDHRSVSLIYRSGEPKDITIDYALQPLPGNANASVLGVHIGFDVMSIGWLARVFLKHHPEIQYGIHPGCALALFDSMRKAA
jgi:hypothetical protein